MSDGPIPEELDTANRSTGKVLRSQQSRWPWVVAVTIIVLTLIAASVFLYIFQSLRDAPGDVLRGGQEVAGKALAGMIELAEAFRRGTVETSFRGYSVETQGTSRLQFAQVTESVRFERRDQANLFWGYVDLPQVIVAAQAPVEYTYYVDLDGPWKFRREDDVLTVTAPPIAFNRPSVDVSALQMEVVAGSLLRDEAAALERLRKGITWMALRRAHGHKREVREEGRAQVERFVRNWLEGSFVDAGDYRVEVRFRDELDGDEVPTLTAPPEVSFPSESLGVESAPPSQE